MAVQNTIPMLVDLYKNNKNIGIKFGNNIAVGTNNL